MIRAPHSTHPALGLYRTRWIFYGVGSQDFTNYSRAISCSSGGGSGGAGAPPPGSVHHRHHPPRPRPCQVPGHRAHPPVLGGGDIRALDGAGHDVAGGGYGAGEGEGEDVGVGDGGGGDGGLTISPDSASSGALDSRWFKVNLSLRRKSKPLGPAGGKRYQRPTSQTPLKLPLVYIGIEAFVLDIWPVQMM